MPIAPTYPGVYIEEIPSGVRTIVGVATSITAFIGIASRGPTNQPVRIQSFADFERQFGGLWVKSAMSYAVQQYFLNGGTDAIIIRVVRTGDKDDPKRAMLAKLESPIGVLNLEASSEGEWANVLMAKVEHPKDNDKLFNLSILQPPVEEGDLPIVLESFLNLSVDPDSSRFVTTVLEQQSSLVRLDGTIPENSDRPSKTDEPVKFVEGKDGSEAPTYGEYEGSESDKTGIYALEKADLFNLLCIPPRVRTTDNAVVDDSQGKTLLTKALKYCRKRRAMLIVDPGNWKTVDAAKDGVDGLRSEFGNAFVTNAAAYFPTLKMPDPLKENRIQEFVPCGVIAGIFARTDAQRGIWKAPAGIEASVSGVRQLSYKMTDGENGILNPLGLNCIRSFPVYGNVIWGARTLAGADQLASEWKYVPVRRLALFMEESLYRGTQWVVFEPNDEPLWAQIRLNIGAFMNNLFRQGAFQGSSPKDAYFVKCDKDTTTQNDIDRGIVNIIVGYAPLKPAEFVIIKFQQIAGQIAT